MEGFLIGTLIAVVLGVAGYFYNKQRRETLLAKYGDPSVVEAIMAGRFWTGMTYQMLRDSLGAPLDVDEKVLKTKRVHVYKYKQTGKNRFGLKIKLEDGIVVGWDDKR